MTSTASGSRAKLFPGGGHFLLFPALTLDGAQLKLTTIGSDGDITPDQAGLKVFGAPPPVQRHAAGRWLKVPASDFTGLTLADLASQLTAYRGPLEPKVRQATLNSRKVVLIGWRDGGNLYVPNTDPSHPLPPDMKNHPTAVGG